MDGKGFHFHRYKEPGSGLVFASSLVFSESGVYLSIIFIHTGFNLSYLFGPKGKDRKKHSNE